MQRDWAQPKFDEWINFLCNEVYVPLPGKSFSNVAFLISLPICEAPKASLRPEPMLIIFWLRHLLCLTLSYLQTVEGGSYRGLYRKCSYPTSADWLQMCPCSTLTPSRKLYHKLPARKWAVPTCKWSPVPSLQAILEVLVPLILP